MKKKVDKVVFLAVAILVGVVALVLAFVPSFRARSIEVSGTRMLDPSALVKDCGLKEGQLFLSGLGGSLSGLASLRYGDAEDKLLHLYPYLRSVQVRFHFPGRISIVAVERVEVAYLSVHDAIVVIDADHIVLEIRNGDPPEGIPLIEGIDLLQYRLGGAVEVDRPKALDDALMILSAVLEADTDTRGDLKLLSTVRSVRPAYDDLIYMTIRLPTTQENLYVREDDPKNAADAMRKVRYAILQGKLDGLGSGILDLSGVEPRFVPDGK